MGDVYKVNLTWTSPMVTYEPSGAWRQAATIQNDSTATFEFYGNGLKWFGSANSSTYTISLDDVPQTVSPRKFVPLSEGEGPTDVWCNYTIPWECMVLAEFDNLDPNTQHKIQLHTAFNETSLGKNTVNLLAMQVSYNTSQPERTLIQDYKVDMDDDKLIYAGNWFNVTYDPNNYTRSMEPGSTISLQFRGYSISVWGTNDISTSPYDISLDGHTESYSFPEISSKDKEVLLWYKAGLDQNAQHTVVVTNQGTDGLIVGGFKYTRLQDPSNPDSADPDSFIGSPNSGGLSKGAIAGIVLGVLFAFFLLISYFLYRRILRIRSQNSGGDGSNGGAQGQANSRLSLRALLGGSSGSSSMGHISPWEDPRNVEAQPAAAAPALAPAVVTANLPQMQQIVFQQVYPQGELPTDQPPPFSPLPTVGQSNANGSPTTPTSTHPPMRKERLTTQSPNATTSLNNRASAAVVGTNNTNGSGPAVVVVDTDNAIVERERGSISSASGNGDAAATSRVVAQHKPALFPAPASTATPTPANANTNGNPGTGTQTPRSPSSPASERHTPEQEVVVGRQSPDRAMLSPTPTLTSPGTGGDASDNSRRNTHQTAATVNTASTIRRDSSTNNVVTTTTTITTNTATGDAGGDPESQIPERPATPPPAYEGPSPDAAGGSSNNAAQRRREARDRKAAAEPRSLGVTND